MASGHPTPVDVPAYVSKLVRRVHEELAAEGVYLSVRAQVVLFDFGLECYTRGANTFELQATMPAPPPDDDPVDESGAYHFRPNKVEKL